MPYPSVQSFQMILQCQTRQLSRDEILSMIDPVILANIKEKEEHPYFKAFVLAHEGISSPRFVGEANPVKISWPAKAIQSMKNIIKRGIKFFRGHNKDNSTEGRESLGEIISSKEIQIDGKLSHIVVGWFPSDKKQQAEKLDNCSMEANWDLIKTATGWVADKLTALTGVALGETGKEIPAFSGATTLGGVQAFQNIQGENQMAEITFQDVENFLKSHNVYPHQLFADDVILQDNIVKRALSEKDDEYKKLSADLEKAQKENETLKSESEKHRASLETIEAKKKLPELIKDEPDKIKDFIIKHSEKWEKVDSESLQKLIEEAKDIYKMIIPDAPDETPVPGGDKKGEEADESQTAAGNPALTYDVNKILGEALK